MMIIIWVAIAVGIYFLWINADKLNLTSPQGNSALKTLNERYAKGEITKEEYEKIKKDIQ